MSIDRRLAMLEAGIANRQRQRSADHARNITFSEWLPNASPHLQWDWAHLRFIRERLERVAAGTLRRLVLQLPPRHGKSILTTVHFSAYSIERAPEKRVIIGSYNATLAEKFSRQVRRLAASRMTLSDERTASADWETPQGGGLRAVGVGGGVTGTGGDLIIIDDPIKSREEANSDTYRDRLWDWYRDDLFTRQEPGAAIIVIMTRWHTDDLVGRILAGDDAPQWEVVNLPAIAEAEDALGREEGAALCPERFSVEDLEQMRSVLGSASFEALYQQRPSAIGGAIFLTIWWQYFRETPAKFDRVILSVDSAFKTGAQNDYTAITAWGVTRTGYYLIDLWKRRVEFSGLKKAVAQLAMQHRANAVLIEDKASGQSLIQELRRDTVLPVLAIRVDADKITRAHAVTPIIEAGRVFLPETAPWLGEYIRELEAFPNAAHDDVVDSTTQALNYLVRRNSGPPADYSRGGLPRLNSAAL